MSSEEIEAGGAKAIGQKETKKKSKKSKSHKRKSKKEKKDDEQLGTGSRQHDSVTPAHEDEGQDPADDSDKSKSNAEARDDAQDSNDGDEKSKRKDERKRTRADRIKERKHLLDLVPKIDENGIAYTKLQTKRMAKRVKRGLSPIETEKEAQERRKREAEMRKEEEAELIGMVYKRRDEGQEADADEEKHGQGGNEDDQAGEFSDDGSGGDGQEDEGRRTVDDAGPSIKEEKRMNSAVPAKKARCSKPVPVDYICSACKNEHKPAHWIYDCPSKVTMKGSNKKAKKLRGINEPDAKKVFVSGLPFEAKSKDVQGMFRACGKVISCKLITFSDTGRCKGQAIIAFETEDAAKEAIKLSGTSIDNGTVATDKKKKSTDNPKQRTELKLKVSKLVNRRASKMMK